MSEEKRKGMKMSEEKRKGMKMSEDKQNKQPKLFELNAKLECSVVIRAYSEEEALEHVRLWETSWVDGGGTLLGVIDVDVFDVRDGSSDDADEDLTKDYSDDDEKKGQEDE